jgi:hypothetical protein
MLREEVVLKVIFLDVDGVLNSHALIYHYGFDYIDEGLLKLLATVVNKTGSEVVLSSTWRLEERNRNLVKDSLSRFGIKLFDWTKRIPGVYRCDEISEWLDRHPKVKKYAILDDDPDAGCGAGKNFFMTDPDVGLTNEIANKMTNHLGRNNGQLRSRDN